VGAAEPFGAAALCNSYEGNAWLHVDAHSIVIVTLKRRRLVGDLLWCSVEAALVVAMRACFEGGKPISLVARSANSRGVGAELCINVAAGAVHEFVGSGVPLKLCDNQSALFVPLSRTRTRPRASCLLLDVQRRRLYAIFVEGADDPNERVRSESAEFPPPLRAESLGKRDKRPVEAEYAVAEAPKRGAERGAAAWRRYLRKSLGMEAQVMPVWLLRAAAPLADDCDVFSVSWSEPSLRELCPPLEYVPDPAPRARAALRSARRRSWRGARARSVRRSGRSSARATALREIALMR
jgi:hypothetical protein